MTMKMRGSFRSFFSWRFSFYQMEKKREKILLFQQRRRLITGCICEKNKQQKQRFDGLFSPSASILPSSLSLSLPPRLLTSISLHVQDRKQLPHFLFFVSGFFLVFSWPSKKEAPLAQQNRTENVARDWSMEFYISFFLFLVERRSLSLHGDLLLPLFVFSFW